jgi:hypothetical protein
MTTTPTIAADHSYGIDPREAAARHLEAARDLIAHAGWTRDAYHDDDGYCLLGAIDAACTTGGYTAVGGVVVGGCYAAVTALYQYLRHTCNFPENDYHSILISHVNDQLLHDQQDALDTLEKAAAYTREQVTL